MKCAGCGEEGAEIPLKHLPGLYHAKCGLKAEYIRQMAAKGQIVHDLPDNIAHQLTRLYKRAMKRPKKVIEAVETVRRE